MLIARIEWEGMVWGCTKWINLSDLDADDRWELLADVSAEMQVLLGECGVPTCKVEWEVDSPEAEGQSVRWSEYEKGN